MFHDLELNKHCDALFMSVFHISLLHVNTTAFFFRYISPPLLNDTPLPVQNDNLIKLHFLYLKKMRVYITV